MALDPGRVKALFQSAIELNDRNERRAFVDREVGGDIEVRARLDALLAAYDQSNSLFDQPLAATTDLGAATTASAPSTSPPHVAECTLTQPGDADSALLDTLIAGRFKLRQQIGEGGMGTVFLAEQTHPVKRPIALKLI
jgi:hypothetical protein